VGFKLDMQKCEVCKILTNRHNIDPELGYVCDGCLPFIVWAAERLVRTPGIRMPNRQEIDSFQ
jgi:hypothetical protein